MIGPKMPFQHREMLTAFEANEMIGCHRPLHRHSRFGRYGCIRCTADISESVIHVVDQFRHISGRNRVVGDMRRDDLRLKDEQLVAVGHIILG